MRTGSRIRSFASRAGGQVFRWPDLFGLRRAGLTGGEGLFVALLVAFAPINYLRLDALYLTASDGAAILAAFFMLAHGRLPTRFFGPATGLWLLSFLLFAGGITLGSIVNGDPTELLKTFLQYFFSLIVLPLLLAGRSYEQTVALLKVLIASITFVMIFGIYVIYFMDDPGPRLISYNGRLRSLIERENECATMAGIAAILLLGLYFLKEIRLPWVLFCLPFLYFGVLLTGSNSGLILTVVGTISTMLLCGTKRHVIIVVVCVVLAVLAVLNFGAYFLPEVFQERVLGAFLNADISEAGTFAGRFDMLREAIEISRDTLFIGLGAGQYHEISAHNTQVHNVYLLSLTEGGLISLIGLVGLLLTGVYLAWSAIITGHSTKVAAISLTVLFVVALQLNMFPTFYARFWNVPLILTMALSASRLPRFDPAWQVRPNASAI
ncbi:MAG: O-antigen ligase family protein [Rhodobacteraceae bacterium]|nr:O-antigen ligase family protein [Paracoccaceae bacterium]